MLDLHGATVIPGFVDSHAHLVFAGDRSAEFAARMNGEPYTGGGIRTTVAATREASDEQLDAGVDRLVREARSQGTTTIEIKSGYGLTVAQERRSVRIAAQHTSEVTFLGAHVVPPEYDGRADDYVDLVWGDAGGGGRPRPVDRCVLRTGSLRRRPVPGDPDRRGGGGGCIPESTPIS